MSDDRDHIIEAPDFWAYWGLPFDEQPGLLLLNPGDWQLHPQIREADRAFEGQPRLAVEATDQYIEIWERGTVDQSSMATRAIATVPMKFR